MSSTRYYIPESEPGLIARKAGYTSLLELFRDIPHEVLVRDKWDSLPIGLGRPLSEAETREVVEGKLSRVKQSGVPPFLGGGAWTHYVPSYQSFILRLGEILTSYTPYQPEASQGVLQALFEYQSLIAEIFDMDVVNSSHYDGSTSLAEALLMALRLRKGRRVIVLPDTMRPSYLRVVMAYLEPHNIEFRFVRSDPHTGYLDPESAKEAVDDSVAAVVGEMPTSIGVIDPGLRGLGEIAHEKKALYIVSADPIASTLYKPPGELGADIAVGEGQPLGLGLNYGGPYLGIMAVRWDLRLIRQMPGRIAGMTKDAEGRRAFALILQTREQHIRRARATSNITTNEALMAILAASYIAGHGFHGLREIARNIRAKTLYAKKLLRQEGIGVLESEQWREIAARTQCPFTRVAETIYKRYSFLIGPSLAGTRAGWLDKHWGIIAVTELHKAEHIQQLAKALGSVNGRC